MIKKINLSYLLTIGFVLFASNSISLAAQDAQAKSRITIASNVRVRSAPNTTADEVAKLSIGTVMNEVQQSPAKDRIGNAEDYWYKVALPNGKEGWLFGSFTAPFDARNKAVIYKQIAGDRLKVQGVSFADWIDLAEFLTTVAGEATDKNDLAWIELARLRAMKNAAAAIPIEKQNQPPFQTWLKANEVSLIYSEPAAAWYVKADLFWNLHKKYLTLPIAEQIAWEGATTSLGGECEGYVPCHLSRFNLTTGRYLKLYPQGAHAGEALNEIIEELQSVVDYQKTENPKPPADERQEAAPELATLRATVTRTVDPKKTKVLQLLTQLESRYR